MERNEGNECIVNVEWESKQYTIKEVNSPLYDESVTISIHCNAWYRKIKTMSVSEMATYGSNFLFTHGRRKKLIHNFCPPISTTLYIL